MNSQVWLERFRTALEEQALPSWYVARLVRELHDHFDEMEFERMDGTMPEAESSFGEPVEVARNASLEFNARRYFQRHPRAKRAIAASALVLVAVGVALAKFPGAVVAGQYKVTANLEGADGHTIFAPTVLVRANETAVLGVESGQANYRIEVNAGDATGEAKHSVKFAWLESDANGKKYPMSAPQVKVSTGQTAYVAVDGVKLHVCVAPLTVRK
jgi:hypothetical protein